MLVVGLNAWTSNFVLMGGKGIHTNLMKKAGMYFELKPSPPSHVKKCAVCTFPSSLWRRALGLHVNGYLARKPRINFGSARNTNFFLILTDVLILRAAVQILKPAGSRCLVSPET